MKPPMEVPGLLPHHANPWKIALWLGAFALLAAWLWETPPGLLGKMDAIAYSVCHRIASRSFQIDGRALPLCARCTGMYLGALVGLVYQAFDGRKGEFPKWRMAIPFVLFAGAFAFDGTNSFLHLIPGAPGLYEPTNLLRLVTGSGMGLAMSVLLVPAFRQTMWQTWQTQPAFSQLRQLGIVVIAAAVVDGLVLTGNPMILYPIALVSSLGVVIMLTIIYTMVLTMLLRKENRYTSWQQLIPFFMGGFCFALLQIGALDFVRMWLTHTWAGFAL